MTDLTDEEVGMIDLVGTDTERRMLAEIRRHRAAQADSAERVKAVRLSARDVTTLESISQLIDIAASAPDTEWVPDKERALIARLLAAHGAKP